MARRVFYSFHYMADNWRASQVRNMGVVEGNRPATDNDWETVKRGGDAAIKKWIADQMFGKSCTVVLIGRETAGRKWINHEIVESWNQRMGVLGVHVHNLKDSAGNTSWQGSNPFDGITVAGRPLLNIVPVYDPPGYFWDSTSYYKAIKDNLAGWIEEAIRIRQQY
jgi:hypothetical protein